MIYSPQEDSYLLEKQVKLYSKNKTVLDIGSGSGIQALAALNSNALAVTATDINPEVIAHLKSISKSNQNKITIIKSNLFSKIKSKFDLIVFNPPYLPEDEYEDSESKLVTTGGKHGDEIILKFLNQAPSHLNKNGIILLLLSSLTPKDEIIKILSQLNLQHKTIAEEKLFMESLFVWEIKKE